LPFLPYGTPSSDDEHWRNILHDLGYVPESVLSAVPTTEHEILNGLDNGLYQTSLATYGSGVDGALQFTAIANGAGTVTLWNGTTLTASSNTYTLTQDLWLGQSVSQNSTTGVYTLTRPTIAAGVTINSNGFRIFCQGELLNNGVIESNGVAASGTTAGTALSYSSTISTTTVGSAGGTGATSGNNGGTNQTSSLGGAGGAGGNNASAAGGAGGLAARPAATIQLPFSLPYATAAKGTGGSTTWVVFTAGSGGASGQGDAGNNSGAGGGGGGIVMVAAQRLSGNGTITANGGAGGAAANAGNSGGGGGGGGGLVIVVSRSVQTAGVNTGGPLVYQSGSTTLTNMTITATGGPGGAGNGQANGNGSAGANGIVVLIPD